MAVLLGAGGIAITRPWPSLGIIPREELNWIFRSSNPGSGRDLYPMLRKQMLVGISVWATWPSSWNKGVTFEVGEKGSAGSSWFLENFMYERTSGRDGELWKECGERRKSRDQDLEASSGFVRDPFARSWVKRFWALGRDLMVISGGKRCSGIGSNDTEGSWRISRTSLIVNAAWEVIRYIIHIITKLKARGRKKHPYLHRTSSSDHSDPLDCAL